MSTLLQEKRSVSGQSLVGEAPADSSVIRSVLLSALLLSVLCSVAVFAAKSMGPLHLSEADSMTLSTIGASVCFTSLPFLVAIYRRQERVAIMVGSLVVFSMVLLAGLVS